jgi:hypothetical protein
VQFRAAFHPREVFFKNNMVRWLGRNFVFPSFLGLGMANDCEELKV